jgi:hypothetical protein
VRASPKTDLEAAPAPLVNFSLLNHPLGILARRPFFLQQFASAGFILGVREILRGRGRGIPPFKKRRVGQPAARVKIPTLRQGASEDGAAFPQGLKPNQNGAVTAALKRCATQKHTLPGAPR